jgi:hypothetical protein
MFGGRERVRRGGYTMRRAAEDARDELLERSRAERTIQTWTVARWLRYWLPTGQHHGTRRDRLPAEEQRRLHRRSPAGLANRRHFLRVQRGDRPVEPSQSSLVLTPLRQQLGHQPGRA